MTPAKLGELVAAMTKGPWTTEKPARDEDGWQLGVVVAAVPGRQIAYATPPGGSSPAADLAGIVALRNHADVLIGIAQAVTSWRDARCHSRGGGDTSTGCVCGRWDDERFCPVYTAASKVQAALAKLEATP